MLLNIALLPILFILINVIINYIGNNTEEIERILSDDKYVQSVNIFIGISLTFVAIAAVILYKIRFN